MKFIHWFSDHIYSWAIVYVFVCYGIFVGLNLTVLNIDMEDPYGIAMIVIGVFWLVVIKIFDVASRLIVKNEN